MLAVKHFFKRFFFFNKNCFLLKDNSVSNPKIVISFYLNTKISWVLNSHPVYRYLLCHLATVTAVLQWETLLVHYYVSHSMLDM